MTREKQYLETLVEKKDGKMLAIASDDTLDRMGDSLSADKWDLTNFLKNPVLQLSHDYNQPPIGIAKNLRVKGKKLFFEPVFHEITQVAKEIKALYEAGIMRAFSVGFIPAKEKEGVYELLEISAVSIPANPNALILAKSFDAKTIKEVSAWVGKEVNRKTECPEKEILNKNKSTEKETNIEEKKEQPSQKSMEEILNDIDELYREAKLILGDEKFEKSVSKSPKCRMNNETEAQCRSRKIGEMIDEGYKKDQAVAVAYKLCSVFCENKKEGLSSSLEEKICDILDNFEGEEKNLEVRGKWEETEKELIEGILDDKITVEDYKTKIEKLNLVEDEKYSLLLALQSFLENAKEKKGGQGSGRYPKGSGKGKLKSKAYLEGLLKNLEGKHSHTAVEKAQIISEWRGLFKSMQKENNDILQRIEKNSIDILTALNQSSEKDIKSREPKEAEKVEKDLLILRALQTIAKNSNFALNKIKKESK